MPPITEADTCRTYVVPRLHTAGWEDEQIREQVTFTDGRIVPIGGKAARKKQQRADNRTTGRILRIMVCFEIPSLIVIDSKPTFLYNGISSQKILRH